MSLIFTFILGVIFGALLDLINPIINHIKHKLWEREVK